MIYEQTHGGSEALLQALMDFDLSDFEVRNIPETPARLDQKLLSMEPIEKFFFEFISNEDFKIRGEVLNFDEVNRVYKSHLLYSFNEFSREHKPNHRNWEARRFFPQFKKLVPFANDKRIGSGPREYEIPSINECRLFFAEKYSLDSEIFKIN